MKKDVELLKIVIYENEIKKLRLKKDKNCYIICKKRKKNKK